MLTRHRHSGVTLGADSSYAGHQQVEHAARLVGRTAGQEDAEQARHHIVGPHIGAQAAVVGAGPQ